MGVERVGVLGFLPGQGQVEILGAHFVVRVRVLGCHLPMHMFIGSLINSSIVYACIIAAELKPREGSHSRVPAAPK